MKRIKMTEVFRLIRESLFDHFSPDYKSFSDSIKKECAKNFGNGWEIAVNKWLKQTGGKYKTADDMIKDMWKKLYSDHEAADQLGFVYEIGTQGTTGGNYNHLADEVPDRYDYDEKTDDEIPRTQKPSKKYFDDISKALKKRWGSALHGTGQFNADDFEDL